MSVGFFGGKFLPPHLGHVYTLTQAASSVDKLYWILFSSENRDRWYCKNDNFAYMPPRTRLKWMGKIAGDLENVEILHLDDDNNGQDIGDAYDWEKGTRQVKELIPDLTDIFASDNKLELTRYYNSVNINIIFKSQNISATNIRRRTIDNVLKYLPKEVRQDFVMKIAVVGIESTGKSTLVKHLAKIFNTEYVPEIGRQYSESRKDQFDIASFDKLAIDHMSAVRKAEKIANTVLFVDTEAVVTQYYLDMYMNSYSPFIDSIAKHFKYDMIYFLMPDTKWVDDGYRVNNDPKIREELNNKLLNMFNDRDISLWVVNGSYNKKLNIIVDDVRERIKRSFHYSDRYTWFG